MERQKITPRMLCEMAMLIALEVIFTRVAAINTPLFKIGLGFLAMALCGMLYGPLWGAVCYALADLLGSLIFAVGAYNPAFTLTAALMGLCYGLLLRREKLSFLRHVLPCAVIYAVGLSWGLNTFWIRLFYGGTYTARLLTRLPECLFLLAVQFVMLPLLGLLRDRLRKAGLV